MKASLYGSSALVAVLSLLSVPALADDHGMASEALSSGLTIDIGVGKTLLNLGDTKLLNETDFLVTQVAYEVKDHDGLVDGNRIDVAVQGIGLGMVHGKRAALGFKGFYSKAENTQTSSCIHDEVPPGTSDCVVAPLTDPSKEFGDFDYSGGFFSDWHATTKREAVHWGAAAELRFGGDTVIAGGMKDEPVVVRSPFQHYVGVAVRRIDQDVKLYAHEESPINDPVHLSEDIDTRYVGAYLGAAFNGDVGHGVLVGLSGDIGLYHARTDYKGHYTATETLGGYAIDQKLELEDDRLATIATGRVDLSKNFGRIKAGVYGIGEFYSFAPEIAHNNTDQAGGTASRLEGTNDGTSIESSAAYVFTIGGNVKLQLH